MDKQNAKQAAATAMASAAGSISGTIGANAVINGNSDVRTEDEQQSSSTDPQDDEGSTPTVQEQHIEESVILEPNIEQVVEVPVTPVDPIVPVDPNTPVDPIDPSELIDPTPELMYGGPLDPESFIVPEPDMYGGPDEPLNNNDDGFDDFVIPTYDT